MKLDKFFGNVERMLKKNERRSDGVMDRKREREKRHKL